MVENLLSTFRGTIDWLENHAALGTALVIATIVMFVGSLWVGHHFLVSIPPNYFKSQHKAHESWQSLPPALRWTLLVGKNLLGGLLIVAGAIMIFTPGQGILSLLLGLALVDVPGKRKLERAILKQPRVLKLVNRMRKRAGKGPLEF